MSNNKIDEKITDWLLEQNFYHGFLPRNDLVYVMRKRGDYILRNTERPTPNGRQRDIVLSVAWPTEESDKKIEMADIKNMVIKRSDGVFLDNKIKFPDMAGLYEHYQNNVIRIGTTEMRLIRAVDLLSWEFRHSQITLSKKVGEGAYGEVYKGKLKRKRSGRIFDVAVKTMKADLDANDERMKEVMAEARLMRMLNHPNIVRIRGIAVLEQPLYIVLDFLDGGGLDSYLKRHGDEITTDTKNHMAMAAAWGIEFMHSQDILHRDIAARNCLYDKKCYLKLSDFGLSRKGDSYKMIHPRKMPTKWLAPESLHTYTFYKSSDVYTYGILLYEIYTTNEPYETLTSAEARKQIIKGHFPTFDAEAPPEINQMIKTMLFLLKHDARATMSEVVRYLENWLHVQLVFDEMDEQSVHGNNNNDSDKDQTYTERDSKAHVVSSKPDEETATAKLCDLGHPAIAATAIGAAAPATASAGADKNLLTTPTLNSSSSNKTRDGGDDNETVVVDPSAAAATPRKKPTSTPLQLLSEPFAVKELPAGKRKSEDKLFKEDLTPNPANLGKSTKSIKKSKSIKSNTMSMKSTKSMKSIKVTKSTKSIKLRKPNQRQEQNSLIKLRKNFRIEQKVNSTSNQNNNTSSRKERRKSREDACISLRNVRIESKPRKVVVMVQPVITSPQKKGQMSQKSKKVRKGSLLPHKMEMNQDGGGKSRKVLRKAAAMNTGSETIYNRQSKDRDKEVLQPAPQNKLTTTEEESEERFEKEN